MRYDNQIPSLMFFYSLFSINRIQKTKNMKSSALKILNSKYLLSLIRIMLNWDSKTIIRV